MKHTKCTMCWAVAVVALIAVAAQVADAQREENRRGRGGPDGGFGNPSVRLASIDKVQQALNLSDDQKEKINEINDQLREDFKKLLQDGGRREEMQKLNQDATAKLADVLDEQQQKRLMGILVQVLGAGAAVVDPAVARELNVTAEQKEKLAEIRQTSMRSMVNVFRGESRDQALSREEMRAKFEELRADTDSKMLAVLTSEQQQQLEALKGEPVEIDMSQLRGQRELGERERRRGDRSRDASDQDDAPNTK